MEFKNISEELNIISAEVSVHVKELVCRTDAYLSSFDNTSLFSFSDDKSRSKLYKENYYRFVTSLTDVTEALNAAITKLAELLERADNEFEFDVMVISGKRLDAFLCFENALGEFSKTTKKAISLDNISSSQLILEARKLRASAEALDSKFSE